MKKIIIVFTFLLPVLVTSAQQVVVDKVIGVVGNKIVLKSELETQFLQYKQQNPGMPEEFKCQLLDQMMLQKMLVIQAEQDSVIITEDEIENELDRRMRYFISMTGSQEKLEEYYQKSVLEIKEEFRPAIKDQLLSQRMQNNITGDVKITPSEIKNFFNKIPEDSLPYFNAEVEVGHLVLFPKPGEMQKTAAKQKLQDIRNRIVAGEDFGTLAILYSEDPGSASEKGELPEFGRNDDFVPEFVGAAFKLRNPGDISEVFESQFGYHIIQLISKKGDRVKVRHILIIPKPTSEDVRGTRAKLDSIRKEIQSGTKSWAEAVGQFSEDENTKGYGGMFVNQQANSNFFEIDQLGAIDKDLPFIIDTMKAGEVSKSIPYVDPQQKTGFRIVYLRSETVPHKANLKDDYSKIQAVALAEKKDRLMQEWLKNRIRKTYVRVDENYKSCENIQDWLVVNPLK